MGISALSAWWGCWAKSPIQKCKWQGLFHNPVKNYSHLARNLNKKSVFSIYRLLTLIECVQISLSLSTLSTVSLLALISVFSALRQEQYIYIQYIYKLDICWVNTWAYTKYKKETFCLLIWSPRAWMFSILVACRASCFFRVLSIQSIRDVLVFL